MPTMPLDTSSGMAGLLPLFKLHSYYDHFFGILISIQEYSFLLLDPIYIHMNSMIQAMSS